MVLLRRVLGDALRARRQAQHRTLREVSSAANVSLGYLSEIERGHKEASSELLSAICDALGAQLSQLLREVSDTLELAELTRATQLADRAGDKPGDRAATPGGAAPAEPSVGDLSGTVSVAVHRDGPLKTTLRTTRAAGAPRREVVRAA